MPKIAIITTVYNEPRMLPLWLKHYRRVAPTAQLIIIDDGSDIPVAGHFDGISVIRLPRAPLDQNARVRMVAWLTQSLLERFDWVIYTDCDELIVPFNGGTLEASLAAETSGTLTCVGINLWQNIRNEQPYQPDRPIAEQRRFGEFSTRYFKPLITREKLRWAVGFHASDRTTDFGRGYYLFHVKDFCINWSLERQQVRRTMSFSDKETELRIKNVFKLGDYEIERQFEVKAKKFGLLPDPDPEFFIKRELHMNIRRLGREAFIAREGGIDRLKASPLLGFSILPIEALEYLP